MRRPKSTPHTPEQSFRNSPADPYLREAVAEAEKGLSEGGIPIGSVLVKGDRIIGRGHNRRVQDGDPVIHAEIDCLRNAGRIGTYRDTVLYSTLMPCFLCAGAAVQFGIPKVVAGESKNFTGARVFMEEHGIEVIDCDDPVCTRMMAEFIRKNPRLWSEDIGDL
ncbi:MULTISPECIES: nucleoside deaminase [unclassified Methanoregula]|uniref:nucleoside deaminase n=1 Tax=unclassified Methanoregula TaxID=2649730 RepID=UPI0009CF8169|nr:MULTISPECIES: nucleoside deaminase [unclassified Methanoregula]OPX63268.1 MAG: tRNA-specific adenosine deaminase [Methanoregula sp. PtaB.Bin085]OPY34986.1 MAG: tRNA-specific adenosine deaminase [Methanoregula sp. PtaU1.Bin006]